MHILIAALALSLVCAAPAAATQEYILPTLFDVTDVAADDLLNIRAAPSAGAEIIGTLAPDASGIEVTDARRGWARINTGERAGWVSARYLAYRADVWNEDALPASFACHGTEPFWSVTLRDDELVLATPETAEARFPLATVLSTGVFRDPTRVVSAEGAVLTAMPQQCSDGMSDRGYGLAALLLLTGEAPRLMRGCCSIQGR